MKFVDWLMELPEALDQAYRRELHEYQEGLRMPYVTSYERWGMMDMIELALLTKFGEEGASLVAQIRAMNDAEKYRAIQRAIILASSLDEVRQACAKIAAPPPRHKKGGSSKPGSK